MWRCPHGTRTGAAAIRWLVTHACALPGGWQPPPRTGLASGGIPPAAPTARPFCIGRARLLVLVRMEQATPGGANNASVEHGATQPGRKQAGSQAACLSCVGVCPVPCVAGGSTPLLRPAQHPRCNPRMSELVTADTPMQFPAGALLVPSCCSHSACLQPSYTHPPQPTVSTPDHGMDAPGRTPSWCWPRPCA